MEACARTRKASLIGAEQNHLCPVSRYPPSAGSARVVLARTSEPPCFSVIAIPTSALFFCAAGKRRGSYSPLATRGSHSRASAGVAKATAAGVRRSAGTQE